MNLVSVCLFVIFAVSVVRSQPRTRTIPLAAGPDTPWDDLRAVLSSPEILNSASADAWKEQCVAPFVVDIPGVDGTFPVVSNYFLKEQPSGVCMDTVSCAYEKCYWPPANETWPNFMENASPYIIPPGTVDVDSLDVDGVALPAMILQPRTASDIVHAVEFCMDNKVGITVKVAGHSYFGASTANDTLLIKMDPNFPKYGIGGSLTECFDDEVYNQTAIPIANDMACNLARAHGKNAVMRVGGGELFDEAYRAVSFDWNGNNETENKYHLVGGGAGTVSAAGGWLASGGLSGTTGMRMYGVGIDQVVALEMVLPNGQHVLFAPTEWTDDEFPQVTTVTGYCNSNPHEEDESMWEWSSCNDDLDFNELWFAARGGGGGTFGIVTSVHYQLHDYPGLIRGVGLVAGEEFSSFEGWNENNSFVLARIYVEFVLSYLYDPELLNVTEADSRGCNSAQTLNLNPFVGGTLFCYGNSGLAIVNKWRERMIEPEILSAFQAAGLPDGVITDIRNALVIQFEAESYAEFGVALGIDNPSVPEGKMADVPYAALVPVLGGYPTLVDSFHTLFPLEIIQADIKGMSEILAFDVLTNGGGFVYAQGGAILEVDDGLNSLSPARRNAAFLMSVKNEEIRDLYYSLFYGELSPGDQFPGSSCHNHALIYEMGPLKTNFTKCCPISWPQAEREDKCISQNEAAWGSANLARLQAFKAKIDPENLFICTSGVGYYNPINLNTENETDANTTASDGQDTEPQEGTNTSEPEGDKPSSACLSASLVSFRYVVIVATVTWRTLF